MGRAQHVEMRLPREHDIVGIAAETAQELKILRARHGLAETQFTHGRCLSFGRAAQSCTAEWRPVQARRRFLLWHPEAETT